MSDLNDMLNMNAGKRPSNLVEPIEADGRPRNLTDWPEEARYLNAVARDATNATPLHIAASNFTISPERARELAGLDCTPPSQRHDNLSEPGANAFDAAAFEFHASTALDVDAAFEELINARQNLYEYAELAETAQNQWDDAKVEAIIGGYVEGKNAEQREAKLAEHLAEHTRRLRNARTNERLARLALEQAQDRVSRIRLLAPLINS